MFGYNSNKMRCIKTILVTGGAGFVGAHLCRKLINEGHKVICVDNLFTGRLNNIQGLMTNERFKFVKHDITEPFNFEVDQIFNLACPASPIHYQYDPVQTIKTSVIGALNVLEIARKNRARILQSSTSEVYGDPLEHPQKESYWGHVNPIGARSCYDEGKRCAESLFFNYASKYDVDVKVIRIFNTYGPYMAEDDNRVISNFIIQALKNEPITVYGNGTQTRSFQYIDDLIHAMLLIMGQDSFHGPVNIGNPCEYSIIDLANLIIKLTKSNSPIVYQPCPPDDPTKRKPDISLAQEYLGWKPVISVEEGLLKTIDYFRSTLDLSK